jgi:G:T-mismatch repair DNA endonuclease (very short patch repair protein)
MIKIKKKNKDKYLKKKKKAIKILKSYEGKETSIEKKIREFLDKEGIYYKQEYGVECYVKEKRHYKVYDFYISGTNEKGNMFHFLVEADGDYWHGSAYLEGNTPYSKLTKIQKRNLRNDKLKTNIAKQIGLPLLRFKEKEIKFNFDKVQKDIKDLIEKF